MHRTEQHVIGLAEGVQQTDVFTQFGEQFFIRNGNQRIHAFTQFVNALNRDLHALIALEGEGLGYHRHGENIHLLGDLSHDRRRAGTRATAHAGGNEQHIRPRNGLADGVPILHSRPPSHLGVGAGAQSFGDFGAQLQALTIAQSQ